MPQHLGTTSALEEERLQRCRTIDIALFLLILCQKAVRLIETGGFLAFFCRKKM